MKRNSKILTAMIVGALLTSNLAMAADNLNVTYDDKTHTSITLDGQAENGIGAVINGVLNGEVSRGSNQAINGSQLYELKQDLNSYRTMISDTQTIILDTQTMLNNTTVDISNLRKNVNEQFINTVQYDKDLGGNPTNSITLKENTTITNVADGILDSDAANMKQINWLKGMIDSTSDGMVTNAKNITSLIAYNTEQDGRILDATSTANTAYNRVNNGYWFNVNGNRVYQFGYTSETKGNDMNFIAGDNVAIEAGTTTGPYNLKTYGLKFSVKANGKVEAGNNGLVTGGMVKDAINLATEGIATDVNVANKVDKDLSNLSDGAWGKIVAKATEAANGAVANKADVNGSNIDAASWQEKLSVVKKDASNVDISAWQKALGNGANEAGNTGLITGATLNDALKGFSGGKTYTAGSNISISDAGEIAVKATGAVEKDNNGLVTGGQVEAAIKEATKDIASDTAISAKADKSYVDNQLKTKADTETVNKALEGKANTDLSNISEAGKTAIKDVLKADLAKKADLSYVNDQLSKKADANNVYTKKETEDKIASAVIGVNASLDKKADKSYVDDQLKTKADKSTVDDLSKTVEGQGKDIAGLKDGSAIDATKYAEKLGTGEVVNGNANLVNGGTVYKALNELKENTGTGLVVVKDGAIKVAADSEATKVDLSGKNGARVLTGIETDVTDATSAANVGYVNSQSQALEAGMNAMNNKLSNDIKNAGAVSAALAGLHHLDYDPENKLDVAVATGHYRGKTAGALGFFYQPSENVMISAGATIGSDDNAYNAGVSFKIGQGSSGTTTSKAAMAAEIKNLKADKEAQDEEIKELKEQVALLMKKMEVSENVEKSIAK